LHSGPKALETMNFCVISILVWSVLQTGAISKWSLNDWEKFHSDKDSDAFGARYEQMEGHFRVAESESDGVLHMFLSLTPEEEVDQHYVAVFKTTADRPNNGDRIRVSARMLNVEIHSNAPTLFIRDWVKIDEESPRNFIKRSANVRTQCVIVVNFQGIEHGCSQTDVENYYFHNSQNLKDNVAAATNNVYNFETSSTQFETVTIPRPTGSCTDLRAAATAATKRIDYSRCQHKAFFLPNTDYMSNPCGFGLGSVGCSPNADARKDWCWFTVTNCNGVSALHEFGHNMELRHAGYHVNGINQYGDCSGNMGFDIYVSGTYPKQYMFPRIYNPLQMYSLGVMRSGNKQIASTGSFTIYALSTEDSNRPVLKLLELPSSLTGAPFSYFLSTRKKEGYDQFQKCVPNPLASGNIQYEGETVIQRYSHSTDNFCYCSYQSDCCKSDQQTLVIGSIVNGATWNIPGSSISVKQTSKTSRTVTIQISGSAAVAPTTTPTTKPPTTTPPTTTPPTTTPPASRSSVCGNGICEVGEYCTNCNDCGVIQGGNFWCCNPNSQSCFGNGCESKCRYN
jgi:hypothetical protein